MWFFGLAATLPGARPRPHPASRRVAPESGKDDHVKNLTDPHLHRLESHRHGFALLPDPHDRKPGVAVFFPADKGRSEQRRCTCTVSRKQTCPHLKALIGLYREWTRSLQGRTPEEVFRASIWNSLAEILGQDSSETPGSVRLDYVETEAGDVLRVTDTGGRELLRHRVEGSRSHRLVERLKKNDGEDEVPNRAALLEMLARSTLTLQERTLNEAGFQSRRQALEEGFWLRAAYHAWRELGSDDTVFSPAVEEDSGRFVVCCGPPGRPPVLQLSIPRDRVRTVLAALCGQPNRKGLEINPVPLRSL
jgi:hypothetical protein